MKTDELREKYLEFFADKGHRVCPSDVLVPTWDPSVLFTPAGMNQFKDHFLGKVKLEFTRATTCQKCLRTGDIDNVGRTAYHHTFFEMLGNFSFGDYFKRDAIHWAWEFLTSKKWLGIDPQRLTVSVYVDDDQAAEIWANDIGLPSSKIARMGEDDNFWPAGAPSNGPDGVCGPCSEIFYHGDRGGEVEIWNLVFTQFNRVGEPPDNLRPLPSKNIDTGMGLERTASMLQGVDTNYHIDILRPLVEAAGDACDLRYDPPSDQGRRLRRIADHIRACTFAIHENVYPGANKEKYVVRRLLRRAVLDGHQLGRRDPFLHRLVPVVVEMMRSPYPELRDTSERVAQVIQQEEKAFLETLDDGLARIERIFGDMQRANLVVVEGTEAADLYQTYGVPPELVESLAAERNLTFDWTGFRQAMEQHGIESGKGQFEVFKTGPIEAFKKALHQTEFLGYETVEAEAEVKGIIAQNQPCDHLVEVGHERPVIVILDRSPFYGEAGGQVGDSGEIVGKNFRFSVTDTQRDGALILHYGHLLSGEMRAGDKVTARVDASRRQGVRRAHSATHILHHALQTQLGSHAQQQGSKVDDDWLRFDFTNLAPVSPEQLHAIEQQVNTCVMAGDPITFNFMRLAEARAAGAMMLFGEKYPDPVRVVSMGSFSRELCGGTHLDKTSDIGRFEILSEEGVSAGTRRIVAVTGSKAEEQAERTKATLEAVAKRLGVDPLDVPSAVRDLMQRVRDSKKMLSSGGNPASGEGTRQATAAGKRPAEYDDLRRALRTAARTLNVAMFDVLERVDSLLTEAENLQKQLSQLAQSKKLSAEQLLEDAFDINGSKVVVAEIPGGNPGLMRQLIDQLRKKASPIAILLAASQGDDKVLLVAGLSRELVEAGGHAGNWVRDVAEVVGGGGGGRPDLAQAGGKDPQRLPEALQTARETIQKMLGKKVSG